MLFAGTKKCFCTALLLSVKRGPKVKRTASFAALQVYRKQFLKTGGYPAAALVFKLVFLNLKLESGFKTKPV